MTAGIAVRIGFVSCITGKPLRFAVWFESTLAKVTAGILRGADMYCEKCKQYEETGMTTSDAWNHCKITGWEYFIIGFECDLVDENGEDNGNYEREMQLYQELQQKYDMSGDPIKDFEGNPW